jgi:hypothetical protein
MLRLAIGKLAGGDMSEERQRPIIGITLYDAVPDQFADGIIESFSAPGLDVDLQRISSGPFAGIELYLPAAVMLYIASGYFNGFLQKAGDDHYEVLKAATKKLWKRSAGLRVGAVGSAGKVSPSRKFSLAYAIVGQAAPRLNFKLILKADIDEAAAEEGIAAFLDLIRNLHAGTLSEEDLNALLQYRPVGGTALVTFDAIAKRIIPVDAFEK